MENTDPNTYTVVPAGLLDVTHATDSIMLTGWVLDKPINSFKVKAAWSKLVTAWPLLAAHLRRDSTTQRWEYHIPAKPTIKNGFASLHIEAPIRKHYAYSRPPTSSPPTISVTPKENPHHLFCPYGPTSIADLLKEDGDRPMVHLHVTTFNDGAVVGLATPHILCDGYGVTSIIGELCSLINGGPPPPPLNYKDPFESYAPKPQYDDGGDAKAVDPDVPAPPHWRVLSKIELLGFLARTMWESLWEDKIENRDVYFPKDEVARIKAKAMEDIRKAYGDETDRYVSSSDAVLAFCVQCAHPPTRSRAPLNIFYTANMRPFLSLTHDSPYLRNTVLMPITPTLPLHSASNMPLGELALHIRNTLQDGMKEEARDRGIRWRLKHVDKVQMFFDPWWGAWDVVTNCRDMNWMRFDFSGALAGEDAPSSPSSGKRVSCVYAWGNGIQPFVLKNWLGLWADDPNGGMWTSMFLQKKVWEDPRGFGRFIVK